MTRRGRRAGLVRGTVLSAATSPALAERRLLGRRQPTCLVAPLLLACLSGHALILCPDNALCL